MLWKCIYYSVHFSITTYFHSHIKMFRSLSKYAMIFLLSNIFSSILKFIIESQRETHMKTEKLKVLRYSLFMDKYPICPIVGHIVPSYGQNTFASVSTYFIQSLPYFPHLIFRCFWIKVMNSFLGITYCLSLIGYQTIEGVWPSGLKDHSYSWFLSCPPLSLGLKNSRDKVFLE